MKNKRRKEETKRVMRVKTTYQDYSLIRWVGAGEYEKFREQVTGVKGKGLPQTIKFHL